MQKKRGGGSGTPNADAFSRLPLQTNCTEENPFCVRDKYKGESTSPKSTGESTNSDEKLQETKGYTKPSGPLS